MKFSNAWGHDWLLLRKSVMSCQGLKNVSISRQNLGYCSFLSQRGMCGPMGTVMNLRWGLRIRRKWVSDSGCVARRSQVGRVREEVRNIFLIWWALYGESFNILVSISESFISSESAESPESSDSLSDSSSCFFSRAVFFDFVDLCNMIPKGQILVRSWA